MGSVERLQVERMKTDKKILDACCGARMMWFDKCCSEALFMDIRREEFIACDGRHIKVDPDIVGDFRAMPFDDESFRLVVLDPPHLKKLGSTSWLAQKYGMLLPSWETDIRAAFDECMRVLKPEGILIFKWNEDQLKVRQILDIIPINRCSDTRHPNTEKRYGCAS